MTCIRTLPVMVETLFQDLRFAGRMLAKNPGFTSVALLALILGIGANTAIFSVVNAALLRSLPFRDPERLLMVFERSPRQENNVVNPQNFKQWEVRNRSFERMAAFIDSPVNITGDGHPEHVAGAYVTRDFFPVLDVQPLLGRNFTPGEDVRGHGHYALLSHGLWQRRYGSDPRILGSKVVLGGDPVTIVGVVPPGFRFPEMKAELWILLTVNTADQPRGRFLSVIARLKPGVTPAQAQSDLAGIHAQLVRQWPDFNSQWGVRLVGLRDQFAGPLKTPLYVLLASVGFVLLIACGNVANLTLIRATGRQRELAVRAALGATRFRIMRQLMLESGLLGLAGGGFGLLFAIWAKDVLMTMLPQDMSLAKVNRISIDQNVLAFTAVLSVLTSILFGSIPAWRASRVRLIDTLKEAGRGFGDGPRRNRLRSSMAAGELAFALILLIGAGLMIKSLWRLQNTQPGFRPEQVLTMHVELEGARYGKPEQRAAGLEEILNRLERLPGVSAAGSIMFAPMTSMFAATGFWVDGRPVPKPGYEPITSVAVVTRDYLRAMGIQLLSGRGFTVQDGPSAPRVTLISQTLARRFFPATDSVGHRLVVEWGANNPPREIIGVVGDVKQHGLADQAAPAVYFPDSQEASGGGTIMIRTSSQDPTSVAKMARDSVRSFDPDLAVAAVEPMMELVNRSSARPRFQSSLLAGFALLALLLAGIGVFGVMAYSVEQRISEIGLRIALGAQPQQIVRMLLREGWVVAGAGIGAGLAGALVLTRFLRSLLFQVSPTDSAAFIVVPLLLGLVTMLACYWPARRALRVDPIVALRYE